MFEKLALKIGTLENTMYIYASHRAGRAGPVAPVLAGSVFHSQNIENLAMSQYTLKTK